MVTSDTLVPVFRLHLQGDRDWREEERGVGKAGERGRKRGERQKRESEGTG